MSVTAEKGNCTVLMCVIWTGWCPVSGSVCLSSEEACVRGQGGGGGVRGFDDRRRAAADGRAQEMAGSLNVCHRRQRGRVLGGQWLAVEGGRYHVQGSSNVVWAGGEMDGVWWMVDGG